MIIAALILAAGGSTRMGSPKHLMRLACGRTMPRRAAEFASNAGCEPLVVLGPDPARIAATLGPFRHVVNEHWATGMGGSIRCGLAALEPFDALVILLADQVSVSTVDLLQLIGAGQHNAAAARYADTLGVPICVNQRHRAALEALPPSAGAKSVLKKIDQLTAVNLPNAAHDVDTPTDAVHYGLGR